MVGLNFLVISIFCLYRALYKIHTWKLLTYENIFAHAKKSIAEEIPGWKNKKKYRPKEERKNTILSRKEKKFFVEATDTGRAPRWRPDFEQRISRQIKIAKHAEANPGFRKGGFEQMGCQRRTHLRVVWGHAPLGNFEI